MAADHPVGYVRRVGMDGFLEFEDATMVEPHHATELLADGWQPVFVPPLRIRPGRGDRRRRDETGARPTVSSILRDVADQIRQDEINAAADDWLDILAGILERGDAGHTLFDRRWRTPG